jgi:hypothetical protein
LQERGVNEHVALFIPEYAEHKEQAARYFFFKPLEPPAYLHIRSLGICQVA